MARREMAAAQRSRTPPRHAGRGRGTTAQMPPLPEDRGMTAQTRPLQGDRGMTARMPHRLGCSSTAAQTHPLQGDRGMTARIHLRSEGAGMTAPAPALLSGHRSVPTAGLSAAVICIPRPLRMSTAEGSGEEMLSVRHAATHAVRLCRLSRMTQMLVCPEGGQQQKCLPIPALRAGARLL